MGKKRVRNLNEAEQLDPRNVSLLPNMDFFILRYVVFQMQNENSMRSSTSILMMLTPLRSRLRLRKRREISPVLQRYLHGWIPRLVNRPHSKSRPTNKS